MVDHFEVLVEEPSMETALRELLPNIIGFDASFDIHASNGKSDLLKNLSNRLRGYKAWLPDTWRVVVVIDRDDDDCFELKETLEAASRSVGMFTRSNPRNGHFSVVNRIAIEELEAWFFGDWIAVRTAYPRINENTPHKASFRDPDAILGGTWEAFERVLKKHGYFSSGLRKIEAAREISKHMVPARNSSRSFQVFCSAFV